LTIFYKSLYSPKEIAKYRFLTIGKTIQHVFILAFLLSLGGFYDTLFLNQGITYNLGETTADSSTMGIVKVLMMIMIYIFISGLLFLTISILSVLGEPVARRLQRKLPYRQSWRLTACSITFPVVLFGLLDLLNVRQAFFILLPFVIAVGIIIASIKAIPKPRHRS